MVRSGRAVEARGVGPLVGTAGTLGTAVAEEGEDAPVYGVGVGAALVTFTW